MPWWSWPLRFRRGRPASLLLTPDGFRLRRGPDAVAMRWHDIRSGTAFKRDLLTVDMVCLLVRDADATLELLEDMEGYEAVEAAMHDRLGIASDWKLHVIFPAFATNARMLFEDGWPLAPGGVPIGQ